MTSLARFIIPAAAGLALGALVDAATPPAHSPARVARCRPSEIFGGVPAVRSAPRGSTHARDRQTSSLGAADRDEAGCPRPSVSVTRSVVAGR